MQLLPSWGKATMVNSTHDGLEQEALATDLALAKWDGSEAVSNKEIAETTTVGDTAVNDTVALATEITLASIPTVALQGGSSTKSTGNPHIRLRLDDNTLAAINTDQAQEVLVIPQQRLTVMPNMPAAVMGLLNHRSRIFWVLDLPQLFGLTPLDPRSPEYHLAILRVNNKPIGLAVQEVQGVTRFSTELIQSAIDNELSPGLIPYIQGCIPQNDEKLLVLDAVAISSYSGYQA